MATFHSKFASYHVQLFLRKTKFSRLRVYLPATIVFCIIFFSYPNSLPMYDSTTLSTTPISIIYSIQDSDSKSCRVRKNDKCVRSNISKCINHPRSVLAKPLCLTPSCIRSGLVCTGNKSLALILALSAYTARAYRNSARDTWVLALNEQQIFTRFVTAAILDKADDDPPIEYEQTEFNDLIIVDNITDSWRTKTLKITRVMQWLVTECGNDLPPYIILTYESCLLNPAALIYTLLKIRSRDQANTLFNDFPPIYGEMMRHSKTQRAPSKREEYLPVSAYQPNILPVHLHNGFQIFSRDAFIRIAIELERVPRLTPSSIVITGFAAKQANITLVDLENVCNRKQQSRNLTLCPQDYICVCYMGSEQMIDNWRRMTRYQHNTDCEEDVWEDCYRPSY